MKMKNVLRICFVCLASVSVAEAAMQWTAGNGHYYEIVYDTSISWANAESGAEATAIGGNQGYLATITSAGENQFIADLLALPDGANPNWGWWLGGSDPAENGWEWVTGPESGDAFTYTNWRENEPNHDWQTDPGAYYVQMRWTDHEGNVAPGLWADRAGDTDKCLGYVVEYVPEPATLILLGLGGMALIRRRRTP